ncbi:MAG: N-acetyl-gamma-glutamyl-phosphate reductase [bacterium]
MDDKNNVAVIGATGYTGQELVRLLLGHPGVRITSITSRRNTGENYAELFPRFWNYELPEIEKFDPKKIAKKATLAFMCLPHAQSQQAVAKALEAGLKVIDLSADFRLRKQELYEKWYGKHSRPDLIKKAVYGMPELYREKIRKAALVANPGCYPTGVILGLAPLFRAGLADTGHVIADMKSGVSGAGRKESLAFSYCEVNEAMRPYNLYAHRHTPEMEQELSIAAGKKVRVTFSPHLAPMNRGILGTIYLTLTGKTTAAALHKILSDAYQHEPFVQVLPPGELPCVSSVRGTNFVDIAVTLASSGKEAIVSTAVDNLVKGASGAALQNMNIMLGMPEEQGLMQAPLRP